MAQDLRDLFKEKGAGMHRLKPGHEQRFAKRLDQVMQHKRKRRFGSYMMAASVLLFIGIGVYWYVAGDRSQDIPTTVVDRPSIEEGRKGISLGDLSPDLRKIEQYYVANINMELSDLEVSGENKAMVDGFMERLGTLNKEYDDLNKELNEIGPNDQTINALITNLQLRLELLYKLKDKLDDLKSFENETNISETI